MVDSFDPHHPHLHDTDWCLVVIVVAVTAMSVVSKRNRGFLCPKTSRWRAVASVILLILVLVEDDLAAVCRRFDVLAVWLF
jgi:hypothetical protein